MSKAPPKKESKTKTPRRTTDKDTPYKFEIDQEVIYVGSLEGYENAVCTVTKRKRKYITEYYHIKFEDGEKIETIGSILKTKEEYEEYIKGKNNTTKRSVILEDGVESLENYYCCHDPVAFFEKRCNKCLKFKRCVYENKGNYKKLKFN